MILLKRGCWCTMVLILWASWWNSTLSTRIMMWGSCCACSWSRPLVVAGSWRSTSRRFTTTSLHERNATYWTLSSCWSRWSWSIWVTSKIPRTSSISVTRTRLSRWTNTLTCRRVAYLVKGLASCAGCDSRNSTIIQGWTLHCCSPSFLRSKVDSRYSSMRTSWCTEYWNLGSIRAPQQRVPSLSVTSRTMNGLWSISHTRRT